MGRAQARGARGARQAALPRRGARARRHRAPRARVHARKRRSPRGALAGETMKTTTFALIAGIVYLVLGVLGLIPAALVPPPLDAPPTKFALLYGYLLGLFPVNILHTALNLVVGALGLAAWSGRMSPMRYAQALAWLFGVLAIMGMLPLLNTTFGLMPLHAHNIWLHAI